MSLCYQCFLTDFLSPANHSHAALRVLRCLLGIPVSSRQHHLLLGVNIGAPGSWALRLKLKALHRWLAWFPGPQVWTGPAPPTSCASACRCPIRALPRPRGRADLSPEEVPRATPRSSGKGRCFCLWGSDGDTSDLMTKPFLCLCTYLFGSVSPENPG